MMPYVVLLFILTACLRMPELFHDIAIPGKVDCGGDDMLDIAIVVSASDGGSAWVQTD